MRVTAIIVGFLLVTIASKNQAIADDMNVCDSDYCNMKDVKRFQKCASKYKKGEVNGELVELTIKCYDPNEINDDIGFNASVARKNICSILCKKERANEMLTGFNKCNNEAKEQGFKGREEIESICGCLVPMIKEIIGIHTS